MRLKEETKIWLMLVMLFVTNYANSERFSRQEHEVLIAMTPKSFKAEHRENNDHISRGRVNISPSRIRYADDKFIKKAIEMSRQTSHQIAERMDSYVVRKKTKSVLEHVKRNTERSDTRERVVRDTRTKDFNKPFLFRSKMALNRDGKRFREDRTGHEVKERNMGFQGFRIAREEIINDSRMRMGIERKLNEKGVDNKNHKRRIMQKLRSLNTNNYRHSSIAHEIRESGFPSKTKLEDRNLNVNLNKINAKESHTERIANLENKTFKPLFKNVETHKERFRQERMTRNDGKRSENERQKRNSLVGRSSSFQLDPKPRQAMPSKRVVVLRLTNIRKPEMNDADRNIPSFEATRFDRTLRRQRNKRIRESIFEERSEGSIRSEIISEHERYNKVHGKRSNARKQNLRDNMRSAGTFRLIENRRGIIEGELTLGTDYRVSPENEKLRNQKRISRTNLIEERNKSPAKTVESIETARRVEGQSTKSNGNGNIRKLERNNREILGENSFRWKLVDNTAAAEIVGKISTRNFRNVAIRSVEDIKEGMKVNQRNRKLQENVQVLGRRSVNNRRLLTTISSDSFSIRGNKNNNARRNEQILVAGRKQDRVVMLERNGRGFRGKRRDIGNPTRENENTPTQRNLETRQRRMDFTRNIEIKRIEIRQVRSIIKESTRRFRTEVRDLGMQPTEMKTPPINAESRKTDKISNQSRSNIRQILIKDRRVGNVQDRNGRGFRGKIIDIRIPITEIYERLSRTSSESRKMVKDFTRNAERKPIQVRSRSISEQRNEKYRNMDNILGHSSSNDEKRSRERSDREFRRNRFQSQTTERNRNRFGQSAVESYSINKVIIPNIRSKNRQERNLLSFQKQNLAFNPSRNGRAIRGKILKQELRISNFDDKSKIIRKQMITTSVPTAEKRLQRMRKSVRRSYDSELSTREARTFLNPIQQLKISSTTSKVQPGLDMFISPAVRRREKTHRKIETRPDIASYSRRSHAGNRSENRQRSNSRVHHRSRILHSITSFSFKHEDGDVQNQKLVRNVPSSFLPPPELNLSNVGSSRSVRNSQSIRKMANSFILEDFSSRASYGNGRSRPILSGSKMGGDIQMLVHSALGSVSMPNDDVIFQKYKPISSRVHRTSENAASLQNPWKIRGMSSTSFIFNALFGMLTLVAMFRDNRLKSRTFKERLFDILMLRS